MSDYNIQLAQYELDAIKYVTKDESKIGERFSMLPIKTTRLITIMLRYCESYTRLPRISRPISIYYIIDYIDINNISDEICEMLFNDIKREKLSEYSLPNLECEQAIKYYKDWFEKRLDKLIANKQTRMDELLATVKINTPK